MAVDGTGRGDQAVAHDGLGVRPDGQLDPVADARVAGAADPDDPSVLDADVRLEDPEHRIDDERAGKDRIELRRRRPPLGRAWPQGLAVAPDRLVAWRLPILADPDPEVGVAEPDLVSSGRAKAGEPLGGGEPVQRPGSSAASPPKGTSVTVRVSPAAQRSLEPASRSRWKPRAALRSNTSRALTWSNG